MKTITILSLQCCVRCRRFGLTAVPLLVWFILLLEVRLMPMISPGWLIRWITIGLTRRTGRRLLSPGFSDLAHFGVSTITDVELTQSGGVGGIVFDPGAGLLLSRAALPLTPTQPIPTPSKLGATNERRTRCLPMVSQSTAAPRSR